MDANARLHDFGVTAISSAFLYLTFTTSELAFLLVNHEPNGLARTLKNKKNKTFLI